MVAQEPPTEMPVVILFLAIPQQYLPPVVARAYRVPVVPGVREVQQHRDYPEVQQGIVVVQVPARVAAKQEEEEDPQEERQQMEVMVQVVPVVLLPAAVAVEIIIARVLLRAVVVVVEMVEALLEVPVVVAETVGLAVLSLRIIFLQRM